MLLKGKKGLITGIANDKSIAWGIAQLAHEHGAKLAFSYQGDILKKRIDPLAKLVGVKTVVKCDVTDDKSLEEMFTEIENDLVA